MRILIDGVAFSNNYQIGVQRYFREFLSRLGLSHHIDILMQAPAWTELPRNCRSIASLDAGSTYDVFHSTRFTLCPLPDVPQVLTIHDLIPEMHWKFELPDVHAECTARRIAAEAASLIICISHATAADVSLFYPQLQSRLRVVHHGAEHLTTGPAAAEMIDKGQRLWRRIIHQFQSRRAVARLQKQTYVLYVGDRINYKNFRVVLDAMLDKQWNPDIRLALVGPKLSSSEAATIRDSKLADRVICTGRVGDAVLRSLYQRAVCFVFSSLAEGFGFPVLEAQVSGCPVVCSDIPVFHEIGGASVSYFNPRSPTELVEAVNRITRTPPSPSEKIAAKENARRFSWDRCAAETFAVYQQAVSETHRQRT